jgi:acetyl-CoA carboxylase biotin carboxyl carrier protein
LLHPEFEYFEGQSNLYYSKTSFLYSLKQSEYHDNQLAYYMDFNQIQELIRMLSKHKISEFSLEEGEFKLAIRTQTNVVESAAPVVIAAAQPIAAAPIVTAMPVAAAPKSEETVVTPSTAEDSKLLVIKSPMVGTFYRSGGPDKPPFVKIGDIVDIGSKVCIIEAMKLFNEIDSEVKGKIVKVLVEDASPVEYDQPLFMVEPA